MDCNLRPISTLYKTPVAVETFSVQDNWQSILYLFSILHKRYFFDDFLHHLYTANYVRIHHVRFYHYVHCDLRLIKFHTDWRSSSPVFQDEHKILVCSPYRFAQLRSLSGNERSRRANCVIPPAAGPTNTCNTSLNRSLHFCYIFFYSIQLRLCQFYFKIRLSFRGYTRNRANKNVWKQYVIEIQINITFVIKLNSSHVNSSQY